MEVECWMSSIVLLCLLISPFSNIIYTLKCFENEMNHDFNWNFPHKNVNESNNYYFYYLLNDGFKYTNEQWYQAPTFGWIIIIIIEIFKRQIFQFGNEKRMSKYCCRAKTKRMLRRIGFLLIV